MIDTVRAEALLNNIQEAFWTFHKNTRVRPNRVNLTLSEYWIIKDHCSDSRVEQIIDHEKLFGCHFDIVSQIEYRWHLV